MGFRFRKSVRLGGVRINFSKSGVGYSIGTKGARITKTANGRTRTSVGIPGTKIGYVSETSNKRKGKNENNSVSASATIKPSYALGVFYRIASVIITLPGLLLAIAVNPNFWGFVAFGVFLWFLGGSTIKKARKSL
jgi:hypothetical protein